MGNAGILKLQHFPKNAGNQKSTFDLRLAFISGTGSPHFTRFHFPRFSLYTRIKFLPNGFSLCSAFHDFLTLYCQNFTQISLYTIYLEHNNHRLIANKLQCNKILLIAYCILQSIAIDIFVKFSIYYQHYTAYMRQLNLPPIIWNESHLKIFPLELLGPAIGFSDGPSSCKGKILRWDTTTNSLTTNKCPILDLVSTYTTIIYFY